MFIPQEALLKYHTKSESDCTSLVLSYHPYQQNRQKLQPLLNKNPHLNQIFSAPPLISYCQPPFASQLVRNGKYKDVDCKSTQFVSQEVSDFWRATTPDAVNISDNVSQREFTVAPNI